MSTFASGTPAGMARLHPDKETFKFRMFDPPHGHRTFDGILAYSPRVRLVRLAALRSTATARVLRAMAIGQKYYLFTGSIAAGMCRNLYSRSERPSWTDPIWKHICARCSRASVSHLEMTKLGRVVRRRQLFLRFELKVTDCFYANLNLRNFRVPCSDVE